MSWKPMDTAPKDGTVIVVYAEYNPKTPKTPDIFPAYYDEGKNGWASIHSDVFHPLCMTLICWIEVPSNSFFAGKHVYERSPGMLHWGHTSS